jgi:hypothetical protein
MASLLLKLGGPVDAPYQHHHRDRDAGDRRPNSEVQP